MIKQSSSCEDEMNTCKALGACTMLCNRQMLLSLLLITVRGLQAELGSNTGLLTGQAGD